MRTPTRLGPAIIACAFVLAACADDSVGPAISDSTDSTAGSSSMTDSSSTGSSSTDSSSTDSSSTDSSSNDTADDSSTSGDSSDGDSTDDTGSTDDSNTGDDPSGDFDRRVVVWLDGKPAAGVKVMQGGTPTRYYTGHDGSVRVHIDASIPGEWAILATHPEARTQSAVVLGDGDDDVLIKLVTMVDGDNEDYVFQWPGTGGSGQGCAHCHQTINQAWYDSPHRQAASNPIVHDAYAGVASRIATEQDCAAAQGHWWKGLEPGTGTETYRCYIGSGALPDLNETCGDTRPCDQLATEFGGCADCHAPGIDGVLGGRSLLEARGFAYEFGVHCDVCHKVESLDLDAPPGVGGRLVIKRPMEPGSGGLFPYQPLMFGPYDDVGQTIMGAVQRDFFSKAEFCSGCHQHEQAPLVPGASVDLARWPDGVLPIQTTYDEWLAGPMNPGTPCIACHMPPDPSVSNSANLELLDIEPGVRGGWVRPPGAVRQHSWVGPRQPKAGMLQNAASLQLETRREGDRLEAEVTVRSTGPGHALPTGEPMRSMVLVVRATCGTNEVPAHGGAVVPEFGGFVARKESPEDFAVWPQAQVGDVVRVVRRTGQWYDYDGVGPFALGEFSAEQKGLPADEAVGASTIVAVDGDEIVFDRPLPAGDVAYLGRPVVAGTDGFVDASTVAGAAGFAFAKVLADADGQTMVLHHRAVDVVSDNRLRPTKSWTSRHEWQVPCDFPRVHAQLIYRPYPYELARERQWVVRDTIMVEASK